MDIKEILLRFSLIASLSEEEAAPWVSICSEAAEEIRRLMKDATKEEENGARLNAAAAALALYRYTVYRASAEEMSSFSAGDIKINSDKKIMVEMALKVWLDAKRSISDLINDDEFLVGQVNII